MLRSLDALCSMPTLNFLGGTHIPKGTHIEVAAALATHLDDSNYSDPTRFDPFRFVDTTKQEHRGRKRKVDMASTHDDFLAFGHGLRACPRRFFAADVLRLMLVHLMSSW